MTNKAPKDRLFSGHRRTLLALTGGALGTSQLPAQWARPLVNSLALPAHAQTSVQAGIVYQGFSADLCGVVIGRSGFDSYSINDANVTAPVFVPGPDIFIEPLYELNSVFIFVAIGGTNASIEITGSEGVTPDDLCSGTLETRGAGSFSARVTGTVNGTVYNASGMLSVEGFIAVLSDIAFTPV